LKNNIVLLKHEKSKEGIPVLRLLKERKKLSINEYDVLVRKTADTEQIVLPSSLRGLVYQELHQEMGHLGAERTYQLAKERVYWPKMEADIKEFISTKCQCLLSKKPRIIPYAPLGTVTHAGPMDIVSIDFLKVDKSSGGFEYILVIVDLFTRYAQAYATRNKSAKAAAEKLFNDFAMKFGTPHRILHDQGGEFENRLFADLEQHLGIKKSRTTPYHPMCNGMVERLNSTILQMLRTLPEIMKSRWKDSLDKLMYAYNCTKHAVTGFSPYFLLFGRHPRLPIDAILDQCKSKPSTTYKTTSEYADTWKMRMKEAFEIAKSKTAKRRSSDKKQKDFKATLRPLQEGDRVLVRNLTERGGTGKMRSFWEQKVYKITKKKNLEGLVYAVVEENNPAGRERVLHRNNILCCNEFSLIQKKDDKVIRENHKKKKIQSQANQFQGNQLQTKNSDSSDYSSDDGIVTRYKFRRNIDRTNQRSNYLDQNRSQVESRTEHQKHSSNRSDSRTNLEEKNRSQVDPRTDNKEQNSSKRDSESDLQEKYNKSEVDNQEQSRHRSDSIKYHHENIRKSKESQQHEFNVSHCESADRELTKEEGESSKNIDFTTRERPKINKMIEIEDFDQHQLITRSPRVSKALTITDYSSFENKSTTPYLKSKCKHNSLSSPLVKNEYNLRSNKRNAMEMNEAKQDQTEVKEVHHEDTSKYLNQENATEATAGQEDATNGTTDQPDLATLNESVFDRIQGHSPQINQISLLGSNHVNENNMVPFTYQLQQHPFNQVLQYYHYYPVYYC